MYDRAVLHEVDICFQKHRGIRRVACSESIWTSRFGPSSRLPPLGRNSRSGVLSFLSRLPTSSAFCFVGATIRHQLVVIGVPKTRNRTSTPSSAWPHEGIEAARDRLIAWIRTVSMGDLSIRERSWTAIEGLRGQVDGCSMDKTGRATLFDGLGTARTYWDWRPDRSFCPDPASLWPVRQRGSPCIPL
jgi:hypothetical protein